MDTLSTSASKDDMLSAFVTVLNVELHMAEFFLESSAWNLETAIGIYMENTDHVNLAHGMSMSMNTNANPSMNMSIGSPRAGLSSMDQQQHAKKKSKTMQYKQMRVEIAGLPADWSAHVSRSGGEVYFRHEFSGTTQFQVPPGFSDEEPELDTTSNDDDANVDYETAVTQAAANGNDKSEDEM